MKIVFWGETKQCGTTSNMLAVAGMLAVLRPEARIEVCTPGISQRAIRLHAGKKKNTEKIFRDTEKKVYNGNRDMHFYFLDCRSGRDRWCREVLRKADLVVVNLAQQEDCLRKFFLYDIHIAPNILILMGKYYELSRYGREYLEHFYRIDPEKFGVIPCNAQFEMAADRGKVRHFVQTECKLPESERNGRLLQELTRFVELLLQNVSERK